MKRSKKGFTLAELLVVVAIVAILVAVSIPIFAAQREKAEEATCAANRRALKAEMAHDFLRKEFSTMPEAFGQIYAEKKTEYVCPKEGTYTWEAVGDEGGTVKCSVHNGGGGSDGGNSTLPGTEVPVVESYWPNESMYKDDPDGLLTVNPGGIFKYGDSYYVIMNTLYTVNKAVAIKGPDYWGGGIHEGDIAKITGKVIEGKEGDNRLEGVSRGDIYHATDGNYYVFRGGWNQVPPGYTASWYKLPPK